MFARLKRYAYAPIGILALWTALLAVLPAVANAEVTPRLDDPNVATRPAGKVVVVPGDSLWSLSAGHLGPAADESGIARGAERLYALNRDRIGPDPDAIYAGQVLVLPRAFERSATWQVSRDLRRRPPAGAGHARPPARMEAERTGRNAAKQPIRAETLTTGRSAEDLVGRAMMVPTTAHAAVAREVDALPEEAPAPRVPVVRQLAPDGLFDSLASHLSGIRAGSSSATSALVGALVTDERYAGRQLLGWALIAASLGIGALPLVVATVRAAHQAGLRRNREESRYLPARTAHISAFPTVSPEDDQARGARAATGSMPSERLDRPEDAVDRASGPPRRFRRRAKASHARRPARGSNHLRRVDGRRKMAGQDPKASGECWDIGESLRHSLQDFPLQLDAPIDQRLARLVPQIEGELRSVALLERRRRLSQREQRQVSALHDLLAFLTGGSSDSDTRA